MNHKARRIAIKFSLSPADAIALVEAGYTNPAQIRAAKKSTLAKVVNAKSLRRLGK